MILPEQDKRHEAPRREIEPYDLLYDGIDLKKEIGSAGSRFIIPSIFLHGRQNAGEYSDKKRRQVEIALKSDGIDFLLENPVIICAVAVRDQWGTARSQLLLAIIDGHHRTRYAGNFGITCIPCLVCTPVTIVGVINSHKTAAEQVSISAFKTKLKEDVIFAATSFGASFPEERYPKLIPFPNIRELRKKVQSF